MHHLRWTEVGLKQYLEWLRRDYESGGDFTKEFVLKAMDSLFDEIMSGGIIVVESLDKK